MSLFSDIDWEEITTGLDAFSSNTGLNTEVRSPGVVDWDQFVEQGVQDDASSIGSHVGLSTNPTWAPTPTPWDYTTHFTTNLVFTTEEELVEWVKSTGSKTKGKTEDATNLFTDCHFKNQFPEPIRPYIVSIADVVPDGNCGFRAISAFMHNGDQTKWVLVRQDLLKELDENFDLYSKVTGGLERVLELRNILSWFLGHAPQEKWMTMPDMGHLIASAYSCVLVHLSKNQCLTFLPLHSKTIPALKRKVIAIGFVDGGHFVQVFLKSNSPMPPVACKWRDHHLPEAKHWDKPYVERIILFNNIIGTNVATKEVLCAD